MDQRPQPEPQLPMQEPIPVPIPLVHRWNAVLWVLLGLVPPAISAADASGATKSGVLGLLVVLAVSYAAVAMFPGNRVLGPRAYLYVLAVGLGAMSFLLNGGAAMFVVALPHFWIYAAGPGAAIGLSALAATATVAGNVLRQAPDGPFLTGNVTATLIGYAASVLLGLGVSRLVRDSEARARLLADELEAARRRLAETQAEALRRQGATDERERLAREIHDTLAQGFASIIVLAEAARSSLGTDPAKVAQQLQSIEHTARENFAEARVLVGSAPQSGLTPGPVAAALRRTLDRFAEDTGLAVDAELPDVTCDQPTRIALLRCLQESLANVRKHADASTVGVVLAQHPYGIELEITDDGRGFVVEESRGFGLDGMRKRLAELGGELTVTSSVGDGTRILATFPIEGQD
ncbi:sensor histidine kinase [Streptomyces sp. NPDC000410]|uniref:sensor histidine kinase n=1 Tax=Streptomyces sp. NPDC000410 TaxID=3154254 RepID=UPI00332A3F65